VQRVLLAADARHVMPTAALAREVLAGPARPVRRAAPNRAPIASGGVQSREKMIWQWPDVADCVIEEWR